MRGKFNNLSKIQTNNPKLKQSFERIIEYQHLEHGGALRTGIELRKIKDYGWYQDYSNSWENFVRDILGISKATSYRYLKVEELGTNPNGEIIEEFDVLTDSQWWVCIDYSLDRETLSHIINYISPFSTKTDIILLICSLLDVFCSPRDKEAIQKHPKKLANELFARFNIEKNNYGLPQDEKALKEYINNWVENLCYQLAIENNKE